MQLIPVLTLIFVLQLHPFSMAASLNSTNLSKWESQLKIKSPAAAGLEISAVYEEHNNGFKGEYGQMKLVIMNAQNDKVSRIMTQRIAGGPW